MWGAPGTQPQWLSKRQWKRRPRTPGEHTGSPLHETCIGYHIDARTKFIDCRVPDRAHRVEYKYAYVCKYLP